MLITSTEQQSYITPEPVSFAPVPDQLPEGKVMAASAPISRPSPTIGRPAGAPRLVSQARNIVLNVFKYFESDKEKQMQDVMKQTSEATKVSQSLINKIIHNLIFTIRAHTVSWFASL